MGGPVVTRGGRAALGALLSLLVLPSVAQAAELYAPRIDGAPERPFARPLHDTVGASSSRARASSAHGLVAQAPQRFYSSDGQGPIAVVLSKSYGAITPARVQPYVDLLASRSHGSELTRLTLVVATPAEIATACSPTALACYLPAREAMIVPGEQTPPSQVPVEYVITHEYGHHLAANRDNAPWSGVAWGPKAWATQRAVCSGVSQRRYFPGDQGANYARNPGENWAETYAQLHFRNQFPWVYDPSFAPDEPTFAAAQRDIATPPAPVVARRSGSLTSTRRVKAFPVVTTLDGDVELSLRGPRRAGFDLQVLNGGKVVARSRRTGSRDTLTATVCQVRQLEVRVVRRSGSGRFTLRVQTPG